MLFRKGTFREQEEFLEIKNMIAKINISVGLENKVELRS